MVLAAWLVAFNSRRKATVSISSQNQQQEKNKNMQVIANQVYVQDSIDVYMAEQARLAQEKHMSEAEMAKQDREHAEAVRNKKLRLQRELVENYDQHEADAKIAALARQEEAAEKLRILQEHEDYESREARDQGIYPTFLSIVSTENLIIC